MPSDRASVGGRRAGGDADEAKRLALDPHAELPDHGAGRRPGAESHDHSRFDQRGRCLGRPELRRIELAHDRAAALDAALGTSGSSLAKAIEEMSSVAVSLHGTMHRTGSRSICKHQSTRGTIRTEMLGMPHSRPMPDTGQRCHELRIHDRNKTWRTWA